MTKYDCLTVSIEQEELLSEPSTGCIKDFESRSLLVGQLHPYGKFVASALLALASATAGLTLGDVPPSPTTPTVTVSTEQPSLAANKTISFAEARRMAQELQKRVDVAYQESLDYEAQIAAVWEEG